MEGTMNRLLRTVAFFLVSVALADLKPLWLHVM
jgi:hypothetical protein